jgi:2-dehydropantoate 2-reductase
MKIVVMGAGGIGGYFGGRLALAGGDVTFVARGAHLAAMQAHGLKIRSGFGDAHIKPISATDDVAAIGRADILLLAIKLWDVDLAVDQITQFLRPGTPVLPLLNGIEPFDAIEAKLGPGIVVPSVVSAASEISRPGEIHQFGETARIVIAHDVATSNDSVVEIIRLWRKASVDIGLAGSICSEMWAEFAFRTAFGGVTGVLRGPVGIIQTQPSAESLFQSAIDETLAVGRATGVDVDERCRSSLIEKMRKMSPTRTSAVLRALQRGQRLDTPWMNRSVVRLGLRNGIPTPVNFFIDTALTPHALGSENAS